jgi:hypothetical protein
LIACLLKPLRAKASPWPIVLTVKHALVITPNVAFCSGCGRVFYQVALTGEWKEASRNGIAAPSFFASSAGTKSTRREAAEQFDIGVSSAIRWVP